MKNASSVLSDSVGALAFPPQGQLNELPEIVEAIRRIGLEVDEAELSKAREDKSQIRVRGARHTSQLERKMVAQKAMHLAKSLQKKITLNN